MVRACCTHRGRAGTSARRTAGSRAGARQVARAGRCRLRRHRRQGGGRRCGSRECEAHVQRDHLALQRLAGVYLLALLVLQRGCRD
eukprot:scaffold30968_cov66-Phaeocystis_antarctica.AAC.3